MSRLYPAAIVRAVRFSRLLIVGALLVLLCGCQSYTSGPTYTKLRATDYQGRVIAEWVARGAVTRTESGYRITAVERLTGPPYRILTKYPDGWKTTVVGPHIARWPCGEPLWLYNMDFVQEQARGIEYK